MSIYPLRGSHDPEVVEYDGYAGIGADAAIISQDGLGATLSKTGTTGVYKLTLKTPAFDASCIRVGVPVFVSTAAKDLVPQVGAITKSSVEFRLCAGATPTDPSAACGLFWFVKVRRARIKK